MLCGVVPDTTGFADAVEHVESDRFFSLFSLLLLLLLPRPSMFLSICLSLPLLLSFFGLSVVFPLSNSSYFLCSRSVFVHSLLLYLFLSLSSSLHLSYFSIFLYHLSSLYFLLLPLSSSSLSVLYLLSISLFLSLFLHSVSPFFYSLTPFLTSLTLSLSLSLFLCLCLSLFSRSCLHAPNTCTKEMRTRTTQAKNGFRPASTTSCTS